MNFFEGTIKEVGLIVQGGLYNNLISALVEMDLADSLGNTKLSIYVLKCCASFNSR